MGALSEERAAHLLVCLFLALGACGRINFDSVPAVPDAAVGAIDAGQVDAEPLDLRFSCEREIDDSALAVYTFDADTPGVIVDALGNHSATTVGNLSYVPGPRAGCGMAVAFTGATLGYGLIADDPAWQLPAGSIDFWFQVSVYPPDLAGLLSRDGGGTSTAGHLGVFVDANGRVGYRLQALDAVEEFAGGVCSEAGAVSLGSWNHLGINFGSAGSELWLNGSLVDVPGMLSTVVCGTGNAIGIEGNLNPFTIGINSGSSVDGSALPVTQAFDGAIDHLRISALRRDFSGPAFGASAP